MAKANRRRKTCSSVKTAPDWSLLTVALGGGVGVGLGLFDWQAGLPWYSLLLGLTVYVAGGREAVQSLRRLEADEKLVSALVGPFLWAVMVWIAFRLLNPWLPHALLLPAAFLAWLAMVSQPRLLLGVGGLVVVMEGLLTLFGSQSFLTLVLNLMVYGAAAFLLRFFVGSERFRREFKADRESRRQGLALQALGEDLGFYEQIKTIRDSLPPLETINDRSGSATDLVELVDNSFKEQLEMLRHSLALSTVALLVADRQRQQLHLRSIASNRQDIVAGPYDMGVGITGSFLHNRDEVSFAPVKPGYAGLPYYQRHDRVGSIYAVKVASIGSAEQQSAAQPPLAGLLVVDRQSTEEWGEQERLVIQGAARKLGMDIELGRRFLELSRERGVFQRVCIGLRELNRALGVDSVLDAAVKAVHGLTALDFLAISLLVDGGHEVVRLEGGQNDLVGRRFAVEDGLVGQAIKQCCSLPAKAKYRGPAPVFSDSERLAGYESLLVLPMRKEEGEPIGALTVASRQPEAFAEIHQEILALIADQVAVKIDLGQAHEQIGRLATTDGLTELANHRTFQHGFDIMLDRARRQESPVCLILGDIDHFKSLNDGHGHPFGDQVLRQVAAVLRRAVRKVDLAARYGGEEFALILEKSDEQGGRLLAERIRSEVEGLSFSCQGQRVGVSISFGLAWFPADGEEKQQLIDRADKALYHAKRSGRNRTCSWSEMAAAP